MKCDKIFCCIRKDINLRGDNNSGLVFVSIGFGSPFLYFVSKIVLFINNLEGNVNTQENIKIERKSKNKYI